MPCTMLLLLQFDGPQDVDEGDRDGHLTDEVSTLAEVGDAAIVANVSARTPDQVKELLVQQHRLDQGRAQNVETRPQFVRLKRRQRDVDLRRESHAVRRERWARLV